MMMWVCQVLDPFFLILLPVKKMSSPRSQNGTAAAAEANGSSPAPAKVEYATIEERLDALEADNAVLRHMLSRQERSTSVAHSHADTMGSPSIAKQKLIDDIHKKRDQYKVEAEKRRGVEAQLASLKDTMDMTIHKKDAEIRNLQAQLLAARTECDNLNSRLTESEALVQVQKKENFRLQNLLKANKIDEKSDAPPDYFTASQVRVDRLKKEVPSSKPFSAVLRSISPFMKTPRSHAPTASALGKDEPVKRPAGQSASLASNDGSRQAAAVDPRGSRFTGNVGARSRSSSPNAAGGEARAPTRYSHAPAHRNSARSCSPNNRIPIRDFKPGTRVSWHNYQAIVRYVGPVHAIGDGDWVGLELSTEGTGEHNGTLNGVRYFSTAPKSAVFCRGAELFPPKDFGNAKPVTSARKEAIATEPEDGPKRVA